MTVSKMKRYEQKPEMIFISGTNIEKDVPEVEVRFSTVNRKSFGKVANSSDIADFIRSLYPPDSIELQEQFFILYLNRANHIMGYYRHSIGGVSGTVVDIKIILATAMKSLSSSIILAHNHPSGNLIPSDQDIHLTKKIKEAANYADIAVLDHLIITRDSYYSFADNGLMGTNNNHSHKKNNTMKELGKIVDTGTVPVYSSTDKYWETQKEPQIIFSPENTLFRHGIKLPANYLARLKDTDKLAEFMREHYAIRGFEFGNWTTQEDRQNYMMGLAVSLYDLQHLLGFDRQQIGFNGTLSIAFGSRGLPSTSGHFEPQTFVINLTRHSAHAFKNRDDRYARNINYRHALLSRGLQSFAHEYGHALDYYCGTYIEHNATKALSGGMMHWKKIIDTRNYHLGGLMQNLLNKICFDAKGKPSAYVKRVKKYSSRTYLLQKNEIFARAFEKYVNYKLKREGWFNVFFSKFKYEEGKDNTALYGYYLTDNEFRSVEKEFDKLIHAIGSSFRGVNKLIRKSSMSGHGLKKKVHTKPKESLGSIHAEKNQDGVMTIEDIKKATFDLIGLQGEWLKLIGNACKPTHFFVYGIGGSGKSSFVLLFSQYLASLGYKILYVAGEQFGTPTFSELINRLKIQASDSFQIVADLNRLNPADFDFVVLDSKDSVGIKVPAFRELKKKYPRQSFIILSQATKAGNFTGNETWRNEVDVMLLAENGVVKSGHDKNRWGGAGEMKVF